MAVHLVSIRPSDRSRVSRGPFCGADDVGPREREEDEEEDDEEEEEAETSRGELGPRVLSADWQTPAYILHVRRGHIYWHLSIRFYRRDMTAHRRTPRANPRSNE